VTVDNFVGRRSILSDGGQFCRAADDFVGH
jgi:hypothetical protein